MGTPHSPPHRACWWVGSGSWCHWPGGPFGVAAEVSEDRAFCCPLSLCVPWAAITPLQPGGHSVPSALGAAGVRSSSAASPGLGDMVSPTARGSGLSPGHRRGAVRAGVLHTPSLCAHSSSQVTSPSRLWAPGSGCDAQERALSSSALWAPASPALGGSAAATAAHACLRTPLAGRTS